MGNVIPTVDEQFNEILSFTINECYKFDKELHDAYITAPKCEKVVGPPKLDVVADHGYPMSKYYFNWRGENQPNCRICPVCKCLYFKTASIGDIVTCGNYACGRKFIW